MFPHQRCMLVSPVWMIFVFYFVALKNLVITAKNRAWVFFVQDWWDNPCCCHSKQKLNKYQPNHPFNYPFRVMVQQAKKSNSDVLFPSHVLQLLPGDPEAFPGETEYISLHRVLGLPQGRFTSCMFPEYQRGDQEATNDSSSSATNRLTLFYWNIGYII